jgi:signal transduction histidine kinase/ligand-binding sensor domain-containing protein/DNA-binding response OmpR family regulator
MKLLLLKYLGLCLACISIFLNTAFSQSKKDEERLIFNHFKVTDGLSQSWVITINQDKKGFMWIGTRDGLNRYDARNFKIYRSEDRDTTTLDSNHIASIFIDSKSRMWVGTANGLNLYNSDHDNFTRIPDLTEYKGQNRIYIHSISEDTGGIIWFTSDKGLHQFDPNNGKGTLLILSVDDLTEVKTGRMKALMIDKENRMWVGVENGIIKLSHNERSLVLQSYIKLPEVSGLKGAGYVNDIVEYPAGTLWLATERGGFFKLTLENMKFEHFMNYASQQGLIGNHVRKLMLDSLKQQIWVGTRSGLSIYHVDTGEFENYQNEIDDPASLSENSIHSIFKDQNGSYWFGTYHGGVNIFNDSFFKITTYTAGKYRQGLNYNAVSAINEVEPGKILIGTEGGGINLYDRTDGTYQYYVSDEHSNSSLSHNNVKCILKDDDKFWIGTSGGGICSFDVQNGTFTHFNENNIGIKNKGGWVYSIAKDSEGVLWLGNFDVGLTWYSKKTGEFGTIKASDGKESIVSNLIRKVLVDSRNRIWIGTDDGLSIYDRNQGKFTSFLKDPEKRGTLRSNIIFCIHEDFQGNIWIGTLEGGLHKYKEESGTFQAFTTADGLPGNNIFGILEDQDHYLWISTNAGISRFNPTRGAFKNYTTQDGLLDLEYSYNSYYKSENEELFFGGRNGLVSFFPNTIRENKTIPSPAITDMRLFNKPVKIGDDSGILEKQITETDHIVLNHRQNVFTLGFSVLNFVKPSKNKYAYRLEGLEEEWNYVEVPSATYTNLKPGTYVFLANGANNDGYWNDTPAALKITVLPAPWKTIWAYLLYFVFILSAIFVFVRFQKTKISLEHDLKLRNLENQQQKELNQAKLRFFTDISHEIRTPLTLVLTPLENLISEHRGNLRLYKHLIDIKSNADRLLRLVNQLLDFRKKDSGEIRLRVAEGNIVKFVKEIKLAFTEHARKRNIDFQFHSDVHELKAFYDRDEMEKVFFNLIDNALKYTPEGGRVGVEISLEYGSNAGGNTRDSVKIAINDNGVGVNTDDMEKIFQRYYNDNHNGMSKLSTGIGLSLSKAIVKAHKGDIVCEENPQKNGVVFSVYLPLGKEHFDPAEIIEDFKDSENIENYRNLSAQFDELDVLLVPGDFEDLNAQHEYTLLIVEDNFDIRSFLSDQLSGQYNILEAADGEEALEAAFASIPDMVITDVIMPKIDGVQLCSQLKNDERTSHIPVIILTARTSLIHKVDGLDSGADEYVTKPFNMKLLNAKIRSLLKSREVMRKKFSKEITLQPENVVLSSPDEKFLIKVKNLMEENISNAEFNVDYFIKEIGMSRPVIYRKIKALTNMSVIELINSYRLDKAAAILRHSEFNIAETAVQVGFSDPKYFSKAFRKKFGISPSQYIKQDVE